MLTDQAEIHAQTRCAACCSEPSPAQAGRLFHKRSAKGRAVRSLVTQSASFPRIACGFIAFHPIVSAAASPARSERSVSDRANCAAARTRLDPRSSTPRPLFEQRSAVKSGVRGKPSEHTLGPLGARVPGALAEPSTGSEARRFGNQFSVRAKRFSFDARPYAPTATKCK